MLMQSSPRTTALVLSLGLVFGYYCREPLYHTDLWGHVSYGRWIVEHGACPRTEPLMPLSRGMPFTDTAWLWQVIAYETQQQLGHRGLQFLHAFSITILASLIAVTCYRRTNSLMASILALVVLNWGCSWQLFVIRPQLAGMVCFAAVLALAGGTRWPRWKVALIPLIFIAWTNLHGSFIVGLALLVMQLAGRAADVFWRTRDWRMIFAERGIRMLIIAILLSAAAVLVNPYGWKIYPGVFEVADHPNLKQIEEWYPLTLDMEQGQMAAGVALCLLTAFWFSPKSVRFQEVLPLVGIGYLMLGQWRMLAWWIPLAATSLGLHVAALRRDATQLASQFGRAWTLASVGLVLIFFACSPFGLALLRVPAEGRMSALNARAALSAETPIDITKYLNENPPRGQVFNTFEWGDYLCWAGPKNLQVYVNSHAHLVPPEVWRDYFWIGEAINWSDRLDHYHVNAVVVDKARRSEIIRALNNSENWARAYSDDLGAVFYRKTPLE